MRVISIIAKNKLPAHHETHMHPMKVVTILILSFHGVRYERQGVWPTICVGHTQKKKKKKKPCIFRVSLCYGKLD